MVPVDLSYVAVPPSWKKLSKFSLVTTALCRLVSSTERVVPSVERRLRTRGVATVSNTVVVVSVALSELAVVVAVDAVTELDTSEAAVGFALVEVVASDEATGLVDEASDDAGAELVVLVATGASELTPTPESTVVVGATDDVGTASVAAGATVVVEALSGAGIGGVVVEAPSP